MLNLDYAYPFQKDRHQHFYSMPLERRNSLNEAVYEGCMGVPYTKSARWYGDGGIVDKNSDPVPLSFAMWGRYAAMGLSDIPAISDIDYLDEECLYCGVAFNHFGHFLVEGVTRLYHALAQTDKRLVYLVRIGEQDFQYCESIKRFFSLLGIDYERIIFLHRPTIIKRLVIPEPAYICYSYFSDQYLALFRKCANAISPSATKTPKKLFFSRNAFNKIANNNFGAELLDSIFERQGYEIAYPEELTLDDQVYLVTNCEHFACEAGSQIHHLLFAADKRPHATIISRSHFMEQIHYETLRMAQVDAYYCDFYLSPWPITTGSGPFLFGVNECLNYYCRAKHIIIPSRFDEEWFMSIWQKYQDAYLKRAPTLDYKKLQVVGRMHPIYYDQKLSNEFVQVLAANKNALDLYKDIQASFLSAGIDFNQCRLLVSAFYNLFLERMADRSGMATFLKILVEQGVSQGIQTLYHSLCSSSERKRLLARNQNYIPLLPEMNMSQFDEFIRESALTRKEIDEIATKYQSARTA